MEEIMNQTSYISTTGDQKEAQTPQNTVMPHEEIPVMELPLAENHIITHAPEPESPAAPAPAGDRPEYTPDGHKIYYFANREKGVIRVDGKFRSLDPNHVPKRKKKKPPPVETAAETAAAPVAAPAPTPALNEAETLLKNLVQKLVAFENDVQYRSVWTHFFAIGGVYTGPRYIDELRAAVDYLVKHGK